MILLLDVFYFKVLGMDKVWQWQIQKVQKSPPQFDTKGAIYSYLSLFIILSYLVIENKVSPWQAFNLGIAVYGIFNYTNEAIFKDYSRSVSSMDTIWGGILFGSIAYFHPQLVQYFNL